MWSNYLKKTQKLDPYEQPRVGSLEDIVLMLYYFLFYSSLQGTHYTVWVFSIRHIKIPTLLTKFISHHAFHCIGAALAVCMFERSHLTNILWEMNLRSADSCSVSICDPHLHCVSLRVYKRFASLTPCARWSQVRRLWCNLLIWRSTACLSGFFYNA